MIDVKHGDIVVRPKESAAARPMMDLAAALADHPLIESAEVAQDD